MLYSPEYKFVAIFIIKLMYILTSIKFTSWNKLISIYNKIVLLNIKWYKNLNLLHYTKNAKSPN